MIIVTIFSPIISRPKPSKLSGSAQAWKQVGKPRWAWLWLGSKLVFRARLGSGSHINQVLSWARAWAWTINSWLDTPWGGGRREEGGLLEEKSQFVSIGRGEPRGRGGKPPWQSKRWPPFPWWQQFPLMDKLWISVTGFFRQGFLWLITLLTCFVLHVKSNILFSGKHIFFARNIRSFKF